ncbi:sugar porter family MFS transporter [Paenibacillus polymyxa]|uniref:sugar porter family MFS transporter n=1 Tax=Paenibacillus polymyxa TaxID=1406 RepID=UPI0025B630D5|nr:sugar porter family MFS transporter [Paenibacillus polymyxa]MDN4082421.1 sugar porter family MFS transporter [Paenibacillus polymyxa]MDN4110003.1 sugar porter family MFS transporter [Paenibacillus polymyxa]
MGVIIHNESAQQKALQSEKPNMLFVTLVSIVAALGGILFGFDIAVVSGAVEFLQQRFSLSEFQVGWAVSSLIVGSITGAALSGYMSERIGRKKVLLAAGFLFVVGSICSAIQDTFTGYVIFRMIGGVGIGITSTICPVYNAEIAPAKYRGRLVALNQLAIVTGIFLVYFQNSWIVSLGDEAWGVSTAWRWMFGVGAVPGLIFMLLMLFIPESPRWLIKKNRPYEALPILLKIHGEEAAKQEVLDIKESFKNENDSLKQLFAPGIRVALFIGIMLAIMQHITGINAILYYAPVIFKGMGLGTDASLTQTIWIGLINVLFTIVSVWLIDKAGRKVLLMIGTSLMTLCLVIIGAAFKMGLTTGPLVLIMILIYVASYAISLGPIVWVMISEIFPNRIRGKAVAIASMALWAGDYLVSQAFPPLLSSAGPSNTFWIFGAISLFVVVFIWRKVPETKGRSLEQMENMWLEK